MKDILSKYDIKSVAERLNEAVRYLRQTRSIITQEDVAIKMDATRSNVSSALNANVRVLTGSFLNRFCIAFPQINYKYLLTGEGELVSSESIFRILPTTNTTLCIAGRLKKAVRWLKVNHLISKQEDIATTMDASPSSVSNALHGRPRFLTNSFLERFVIAFPDISLEWLQTGEGEMLNIDRTKKEFTNNPVVCDSEEALERAERLKKAFQYLRINKKVRTQEELASFMNASRTNVSAAFRGNPRFLTSSFLMRFTDTFPEFNLGWLENGEGEMIIGEKETKPEIGTTLHEPDDPTVSHLVEILSTSISAVENELRSIRAMSVLVEQQLEELKKFTEASKTTYKTHPALLDLVAENNI